MIASISTDTNYEKTISRVLMELRPFTQKKFIIQHRTQGLEINIFSLRFDDNEITLIKEDVELGLT